MPAKPYAVVSIPSATSSEHLRALDEVKDFLTTDMGRGGSERWTYRILPDHILATELRRQSHARSQGSVDSVSFQPFTMFGDDNQDRYSVEEWELADGKWLFTAIYDGHCGHDAVHHVHSTLPKDIRKSLEKGLKTSDGRQLRHDFVSKILCEAVEHLDDCIRADLLNFLPPEKLCAMTDVQLEHYIHRNSARWSDISARCIQGSTVLLALTDPCKQNLWVVNLGDSQAVLGVRKALGKWSTIFINCLHNGNSPSEQRRIRREHPGEQQCILDGRLIGYLAPTRVIGDMWLKIPTAYTTRLFQKFCAGWMSPKRAQELSRRILTPPYISSSPEVYHHTLADDRKQECFLLLCSDGLLDLYNEGDHRLQAPAAAERCVQIIGQALNHRARNNLALNVLRDAIGGDDIDVASRNLTVEMEEKWMDDVTILVERL